MTDITERLRNGAALIVIRHNETGASDLFVEAADEIDQLRARIAELEAQRVPEGCALIPLTERMPDPDKHPRVVVYTEGTDFAGEQFFDVQAESLNEWFYEYPEDQPEVCRYATHWIGADELAARAQPAQEKPE